MATPSIEAISGSKSRRADSVDSAIKSAEIDASSGLSESATGETNSGKEELLIELVLEAGEGEGEAEGDGDAVITSLIYRI